MKKKKRLFAILLALCVGFTMMPLAGSGGVAHAEDGNTVNTVVTRTTTLDLTSKNGKYMATDGKEKTVDFTTASVNDSAEGWEWDHQNKVLTLSGAQITVTEPVRINNEYYGIFIPKDTVTIVLKEGTESFVQAGDAVGEDIGGTIFSSTGIGNQQAYSGQLTICGSGKLIAKGGKLDNSNKLKQGQRTSAGIFFFAPKGIVIKENAVVEAYGGESRSSFSGAYSEGIMSQTVKITDHAKTTARGGAVCGFGYRSSFGMRVSTDLVIDGNAIVKCYGGNVTKQGDNTTTYSCSAGIHTPKLSFSADARVYAFGGESRNQAEYSAGIYLYGSGNSSLDAKLSGNAFLHAEGGISEYSNYGIAARPDKSRTPTLTVSENAYLEAAAKESLDYEHCKCIGIRFMKIHINGGTVIASAKTSATKGSIAAISFSTESQAFPNLTYAEGLQPVVKAGKTETEAVEIESPNENTYTNRWVKIQTSQPNYAITAAPSVIDFGTVKTGYAQPTPKTVTITNTGNETVDLRDVALPENSNYIVSELSGKKLAPRETAEFTVQPNGGLAAGTYNETLTISGSDGAEATVTLTFSVSKNDESGSGGSGSSGGGSYVPVQKPAILAGEGFHTTLSADGTKLTITAADGYEITDVLLNGTSKGSVTQLSGLKTDDKVEIKTAKKADNPPSDDASLSAVKRKVARMQSYARSSKTPNQNIKLVLKLDEKTTASIEALQKLGYTIKYKFYRSTKKSSGYKASIVKKTGTYINTSGKKGVRYYYKARIMVYDKNGKLIAQTKLKQCQYACRVR